MKGTLIFVYNADEGVVAALGDAVHKLLSPATYPCSLCAVSYGAVRMRPAWAAYLKGLPYTTRFHHRPDFRRAFPDLAALPLPAILLDKGSGPRLVVDAATLDRVEDVAGLIAVLQAGLARAAG